MHNTFANEIPVFPLNHSEGEGSYYFNLGDRAELSRDAKMARHSPCYITIRRRVLSTSLVLTIITVIIVFIMPSLNMPHAVFAAQCDDDDLQEVASDGEILIMSSGAVYEVLAGDTIDSALWLPPADVIICERSINIKGQFITYYEIVNVDEKEKVGARKLR